MSYVLVVEDDEFYAKIYQKKIAEAGLEVKVFGDGLIALKEAEVNVPKVIVLDLVMPKIDGFLLLQKIKKIEKLSKIPVIVISNLSQDQDIEEAKRLGANQYLVKNDTSLKEVISTIVRYFGE